MKELTEAIQTVANNLFENLGGANKGNKAAAARARKNTLELEKLFKQFRKVSIEEAKK